MGDIAQRTKAAAEALPELQGQETHCPQPLYMIAATEGAYCTVSAVCASTAPIKQRLVSAVKSRLRNGPTWRRWFTLTLLQKATVNAAGKLITNRTMYTVSSESYTHVAIQLHKYKVCDKGSYR